MPILTHPLEQTVLTCGLLLCIPSSLLLVYFKDSAALGLESEAQCPQGAESSEANAYAYAELDSSETEAEQAETDSPEQSVTKDASMFWVPLITSCSDITVGIASGMTIKFFPLFFKGAFWIFRNTSERIVTT